MCVCVWEGSVRGVGCVCGCVCKGCRVCVGAV